MTPSMDAIIALGSNIGDKVGHLSKAATLLEATGDVAISRRSKLYRTEAWGVEDQEWFVNACLGITTTLEPLALLNVCQRIETDMGRVRDKRWGPRVIDLDILIYKNVTRDDPVLTLPHPLITERAFVLVPLNDIAPGLVLKGQAVSEWLRAVDYTGVAELDPITDQRETDKK